jgi:hypothetical protein
MEKWKLDHLECASFAQTTATTIQNLQKAMRATLYTCSSIHLHCFKDHARHKNKFFTCISDF